MKHKRYQTKMIDGKSQYTEIRHFCAFKFHNKLLNNSRSNAIINAAFGTYTLPQTARIEHCFIWLFVFIIQQILSNLNILQ